MFNKTKEFKHPYFITTLKFLGITVYKSKVYRGMS
ncbi:hypothetical protein JOC93_000606 [Priestia taiwanensis]|nr:hypothetical protein [Priestia taiwanensis]